MPVATEYGTLTPTMDLTADEPVSLQRGGGAPQAKKASRHLPLSDRPKSLNVFRFYASLRTIGACLSRQAHKAWAGQVASSKAPLAGLPYPIPSKCCNTPAAAPSKTIQTGGVLRAVNRQKPAIAMTTSTRPATAPVQTGL